jgi:hypothetical protein
VGVGVVVEEAGVAGLSRSCTLALSDRQADHVRDKIGDVDDVWWGLIKLSSRRQPVRTPLLHRVTYLVGGLVGETNHFHIEDLFERGEFVVVVAVFAVLW